MTPGTKPTPTALKELAGNPGKRPLNKLEPKPKVTVPKCPAHIRGEARREWYRTGELLAQLGVLTEADRSALELYCQLYQRWLEAEEMVRKTGILVKTPNGYPIQNPALAVANQTIKQMRGLLAEFGMTPASRSRLQVQQVEEESLADQLFRIATSDDEG